MAITYGDFHIRVGQFLDDQDNCIYDDDVVEEGVRQALDVYSKARPYHTIGTITLTADGREISLSSLTGLIDISRVWAAYDSSDPAFPPLWRTFEHWQDQSILYIDDPDYYPVDTDVVRVFYTTRQTLNGLDGETTTTFLADDESVIVLGAAGYTILSQAVRSAKHVQIDAVVPISEQLRKLGRECIAEFYQMLGLGEGGVVSVAVDEWLSNV